MSSTIRHILPALASLALAAPAALSAQDRPTPKEYGIDAGLTVGLGDNSYTAINLPAQRLRVGFFTSPKVSIEPYGSLQYFNTGDNDATNLSVGTGVLYHFQPLGAGRQVYVRPFAEVNHLTADESDTQFGLGAGLGIRVPFRSSFATRFEANLGHSFKSDARGSGTSLGVGVGLSFLTR